VVLRIFARYSGTARAPAVLRFATQTPERRPRQPVRDEAIGRDHHPHLTAVRPGGTPNPPSLRSLVSIRMAI